MSRYALPVDWWCGLLSITMMALLGCSGGDESQLQRVSVHGSVSLDGEPLIDGMIRFAPDGETKGPKTSIPVRDGVFHADEVDGPIVGSHRVEVESMDDGGYAWDDEDALPRMRNSDAEPVTLLRIPDRYNRHSILKADVIAGTENELNFQLNTQPE